MPYQAFFLKLSAISKEDLFFHSFLFLFMLIKGDSMIFLFFFLLEFIFVILYCSGFIMITSSLPCLVIDRGFTLAISKKSAKLCCNSLVETFLISSVCLFIQKV